MYNEMGQDQGDFSRLTLGCAIAFLNFYTGHPQDSTGDSFMIVSVFLNYTFGNAVCRHSMISTHFFGDPHPPSVKKPIGHPNFSG